MTDIANSTTPADSNATQTQNTKKDRVSMWIALAAAVGAIAAAVVASVQVHEASQQNILSVQQQLLQLATTISQQYDERSLTIDQAAGTLTGSARTAALSQASIAWTDQLLAEGEAGAVLISYLDGRGTVASIEYIAVGNALVAGQDETAAIPYYKDAVNAPPHSPLSQVDALRSEGSAYYGLGEIATGHALMMQSVTIYTESKSMPKAQVADSVGQSFAIDAWHEMQAGNCKIGLAEFNDASKVLGPVDGGNTTDEAWMSTDVSAYKKNCISGSTSASNG